MHGWKAWSRTHLGCEPVGRERFGGKSAGLLSWKKEEFWAGRGIIRVVQHTALLQHIGGRRMAREAGFGAEFQRDFGLFGGCSCAVGAFVISGFEIGYEDSGYLGRGGSPTPRI